MNPLVNVLMVLVPILLVTNLGIHNIEEGYVGVYYRVIILFPVTLHICQKKMEKP